MILYIPRANRNQPLHAKAGGPTAARIEVYMGISGKEGTAAAAFSMASTVQGASDGDPAQTRNRGMRGRGG